MNLTRHRSNFSLILASKFIRMWMPLAPAIILIAFILFEFIFLYNWISSLNVIIILEQHEMILAETEFLQRRVRNIFLINLIPLFSYLIWNVWYILNQYIYHYIVHITNILLGNKKFMNIFLWAGNWIGTWKCMPSSKGTLTF